MFTVVLVSGCSSELKGQAVRPPVTSDSGYRQVDDSGVRLPFETVHSRRWNAANDGTSFEPCTALAVPDLYTVGVDPGSVEDAAGTNGQTLRGCKWLMLGASDVEAFRLSQVVGNSPGLAEDKHRRSAARDVWLEDRVIDGRRVGVHRVVTGWSCDTYVESGRAAVSTIVNHFGTTKPDPDEICERALAFTRATIDKMPL